MLRFFRVPILLKRRDRFLSATQAPVTGLTDILTPVNLLPNSDFSRDGGYASSQTYESVSSNFTFREHWQIRLQTGSVFNNFSININNSGSITITGTPISTTSSSYFSFSLYTGQVYKYKKYYTICVDKSDLVNVNDVYPQTNGSANEIYAISNDSPNRSIYVFQCENSSTQYLSFTVFTVSIPLSAVNQQFSITLKNFAVYEGQFKNPPVTTSLDIMPNNITYLTEDIYRNNYRFQFRITSDMLTHWVRLCPISCGVTHNAGRIFLIKGYTPLQDSSLLLDFACNNVTNSDGRAYAYIRIVSAIARALPTGNKWPLFITKLRIAKTANNSEILYLEGKIGDTSSYVLNAYFTSLLLNNSNSKELINYNGGTVYAYDTYKSTISDQSYQIADNDIAISEEVSTPSTNGFIS